MDPIVFTFNGFQIRYFSVLLASGVLILFFMLRTNLRQAKIRIGKEELLDWVIIVFIYGVIGARIYYVLLNLDYYFRPEVAWYEFIAFWRGGMALNGGILFSIFALWVLGGKRNLLFERLTDQVVAPLFIVQALARIGNLLNGESFGLPTDHMVGIAYKYGPVAKHYSDTPLHPVLLYESLLCLLGFFIINILRKVRFRSGFTTICALFWYSLLQIFSGIFSTQGLTIMGRSEPVIFGFAGALVSIGILIGGRLYRKLPSPDEQFPSTRKWFV
jgi:phosphatidylglycerol:prolipoprotein diacylglycerol transferase